MSDILICDNCGRLHIDDHDALSESCACGRFKQRMEWATDDQIKDELDRVYREVNHNDTRKRTEKDR